MSNRKIKSLLPKYSKIPPIVKRLDLTENQFNDLIHYFPEDVKDALKEVFYDNSSYQKAGLKNNLCKHTIIYYLKKMEKMKNENKGKKRIC